MSAALTPRFLAILISAYGFALSLKSTRTIRRIGREAEAGSEEAGRHFTQTRYAHVLGPRNSDLGMLFYGFVGGAALTGLIRRPRVLTLALIASLASVGMSLYLLWALLFRLRVACSICIRGHITNLALVTVLLKLSRRG